MEIKGRLFSAFSPLFAGGKEGNKLMFGAKVVRKDKEKIIDYYEYTPLDEDAFDANSFAAVNNYDRDGFIPKNNYKVGNFVSKEYLGSLDLNNPALFEKEQVAEELASNYNARETVTAGYLRLNLSVRLLIVVLVVRYTAN